MLEHMYDHSDLFICPACGGDLVLNVRISCKRCARTYLTDNGIPLLFEPNDHSDEKDVTSMVKEFYEKTPFPNYDGFEAVGDLMKKAEQSIFAKLLNEQIPFNVKVLEVGCGTGQLTNYLGVAHRFVFGVDMCLNSLKLAQNFKETNRLQRVGFYQMNLFNPIFKDESFDLVICNGVLHHTTDPFGGFRTITKLVRKGGYVLIGLYNKYGRISTDVLRIIFRCFGDRLKFLDPRMREMEMGEVKKRTWFDDQYNNPHESKHTIGEVIEWFDKTGFDFVYGIPNLKAFSSFDTSDLIFDVHQRGGRLDHFIVQSQLVVRGSREGGFFSVIGKRKK